MPISKRLILCGFGNVGRAFARLLAEKRAELAARYDLELPLAAVVDIGGAAVARQAGLPIGRLLDFAAAGGRVEAFGSFGRPGQSGASLIADIPADILVEATPTNLKHGEPARGHFEAALARGLCIVSANKGPLVLFYRDLTTRARAAGVRLAYSAATAAALPTLDVGRLCTAGARILAIEGILNGTTNYILTRMAAEGCAYEEALAAAQALGIAETDPTLDVAGFDTRNKLLLLANNLFELDLGLEDIPVNGITGVTPAAIQTARAKGQVIKLIGSARREGARIAVQVAPEALPLDHPLAGVNLSEKGVSYATDTMGRITVTGGHSSPTGAAAALLKDIIHLCVPPF
jgi:homoserine dehydrogenase